MTKVFVKATNSPVNIPVTYYRTVPAPVGTMTHEGQPCLFWGNHLAPFRSDIWMNGKPIFKPEPK